MLQLLIRHGESLSNVEGRIQGQSDVSLSPLGRRQADDVARWLAGRGRQGGAGSEPAGPPGTSGPPGQIDEIWSSPLARARETALVIAAALGLPVQVEERLKELHAGIFQGHLWSDLETRFPGETARWRSGDPDYAIPGGESRAALAARGHAALEDLARRPASTILVVAHGGLLTAALGSLLGGDHPALAAAASRPFTRMPALANASVTRLAWPGPRLEGFNETGHLGAFDAAAPGGDGA
ncbi:MAG: histidine phosphatase family protein [Pirellulales bacterium]